MAQEIDSLELKVQSDSAAAIASLEKLESKLTKIADTLGILGKKKIQIDFSVSGGATKTVNRMESYTKKAAQSMNKYIQKAFSLDSKSMSGVKAAVEEFSKTYNGDNGANAMRGIVNAIIEAENETGKLTTRWKEFYDTVKAIKQINISPETASSLGDTWKEKYGLLNGKMNTKGAGIDLDTLFNQWKDEYADLFSGYDLSTAEDQFYALNDVLRNIGDRFSNIDNQAQNANSSMSFAEQQSAIWSKLSGEIESFYQKMETANDALQSTGGSKVTESTGFKDLGYFIQKIAAIDIGNLSSAASAISSLSAGIKSLDGTNVNVAPIQQAISAINEIGKKGNSTAISNFQNIGNALQGFSSSAQSVATLTAQLQGLASVSFKDSGLNAFINALTRLLSVDIGNFNTSGLQAIITSLASIGNIPDVSSSVNKIVSSLARLAATGSSIGAVSSELPTFGNNIKTAVDRIASASAVPDSINNLVNAVSKLASAGGKSGEAASGLKALADGIITFMTAMQSAPDVSDKVVSLVNSLAQLSNASFPTAMNQMASSGSSMQSALSTAFDLARTAAQSFEKTFKAMANIVVKSAKTIASAISTYLSGTVSVFKSVGSAISSLYSKIKGGSSDVNSFTSNFSSLLKTVIGFQGIAGVFNWAKEAVELGSDITEVENVVDVSFGSMANKVYEFAETATEQFGLSELAAKQYAGTLMSIMKSSGVAQSDAADMSLELAGLAGDLASFYNIETDTAFEKLQAGITGQIQPLRQLGINLTEANLEEYALANGITTSYSAMTQAEKIMLRYNYIMSATTSQTGDFARTAGRLCAA